MQARSSVQAVSIDESGECGSDGPVAVSAVGPSGASKAEWKQMQEKMAHMETSR